MPSSATEGAPMGFTTRSAQVSSAKHKLVNLDVARFVRYDSDRLLLPLHEREYVFSPKGLKTYQFVLLCFVRLLRNVRRTLCPMEEVLCWTPLNLTALLINCFQRPSPCRLFLIVCLPWRAISLFRLIRWILTFF